MSDAKETAMTSIDIQGQDPKLDIPYPLIKGNQAAPHVGFAKSFAAALFFLRVNTLSAIPGLSELVYAIRNLRLFR